MRPAWGLAVLGLMFLASGVAADPAVTSIGAHEGEAVWAFSNPSNYTFVNATITGPGVSLATVLGSAGDTTQAEFAQANATTNIDLAGSPGDAMIANTSQSGVPANLKFQPTPSQLEDTFLHKGGGGNTNFGASSDLWVGYWGNPEWNRALIRLPTFPVPANATVVDARIELYLYATATLDSASIAVHRVTTGWLELGATWNDYDGSNPWNASVGGGDFDPASVDVVAGITNATGWYAWNVTSLVRGWLAGTYANDGMLFRAVGDDARLGTGRKQFFASDAPNATLRPRFTILYVTADSTGLLDSRSLDAGGAATWQRIRWNANVPAGTSIEIRTRTGSSSSVDASWSAWSAPYASSGNVVGVSSSTRSC
ncbi:MAG: DNRLRE domain-containing protein [Methanobacteriota archaeon]|nr:MAG: DNRLRE domain-containing protein [Euryarchaeota archaeon]